MPPRFLSASHPYVKFGSLNHGKVAAGGPYVILSHVWQDIEQPHEDVLRFERETTAADDPRLSIKIRECHRLARAYGFDWFWIDAPCIDQKNSVELSEAIRSMYHWYASASICFAHLPDVPSHDPIRDSRSTFRRSVYFRRGWTLQELIAPRRVIFLSSDWTVLGEKDELADLLEDITGIDQDVLKFRRRVADVSVARRLSWASLRETRRVEDQAYCLMGLFDIHMPIMYGEGDKAFLRLQQAILAQISDHTLFAWGGASTLRRSRWQTEDDRGEVSYSTTSLFAPSPAAFSRSRSMVPVDIEAFMSSMEALAGDTITGRIKRLPRFSLDHYGLRCHLPIMCRGSTPVAAILACQDQDHSCIALPLHPQGTRSLLYGVRNLEATKQLSADPGASFEALRLLRVPSGNYIDSMLSSTKRSSAADVRLNIRFMSIHIAMRHNTPFSPPPLPLPPLCSLHSNHVPRCPCLPGAESSDALTKNEISYTRPLNHTQA